ncbi:MAG: thioredoxin fold domain-containing protein [Myxococcota bacterium]|nr:thioredoxin fold domain-containing protein [Myxococcota bacterium]
MSRPPSLGSVAPYVLVLVVGSILLVRSVEWTPSWSEVTSVPPGEGWTSSYLEAESTARAAKRVLMVYFGADWCAPCKDLEDKTFVNGEVLQAMESVVAVKVDGSEMTGPVRGLFEKYRIYSLPTIVFVGSEGRVLESSRIHGYIDAKDFVEVLRGF